MSFKRISVAYGLLSAAALIVWAYYVDIVVYLLFFLAGLNIFAALFSGLAIILVNGWIYITAALPTILSIKRLGFQSPVTLALLLLPISLVIGPVVEEMLLDAELNRRLEPVVVNIPTEPIDLDYIEIVHSSEKQRFNGEWAPKQLAESLLRLTSANIVTTLPTDRGGTLFAGFASSYARSGETTCDGVDCLPDIALRIGLSRHGSSRGLFYGIEFSEQLEISEAPPTRPGDTEPPIGELLLRQHEVDYWLARAPFLVMPGRVRLLGAMDPSWHVVMSRRRLGNSFEDRPWQRLEQSFARFKLRRQVRVRRERRLKFVELTSLERRFAGASLPAVQRAIELGRVNGEYDQICEADLEILKAARPDIEKHLQERSGIRSKIKCQPSTQKDKDADLDGIDVTPALISGAPPPAQLLDCRHLNRNGHPVCSGFLILHWEDAPPQHRMACRDVPRFYTPKYEVLEQPELLPLIKALHRAGAIQEARDWSRRIAPWDRSEPAVKDWLEHRTYLKAGFPRRHCTEPPSLRR